MTTASAGLSPEMRAVMEALRSFVSLTANRFDSEVLNNASSQLADNIDALLADPPRGAEGEHFSDIRHECGHVQYHKLAVPEDYSTEQAAHFGMEIVKRLSQRACDECFKLSASSPATVPGTDQAEPPITSYVLRCIRDRQIKPTYKDYQYLCDLADWMDSLDHHRRSI